ncbi:hypothetical protein X975_04818, partial [Stegodyphus mimosarum]
EISFLKLLVPGSHPTICSLMVKKRRNS